MQKQAESADCAYSEENTADFVYFVSQPDSFICISYLHAV